MNAKERILNLIKKNFESDADFERTLQLKPKTVDSWRRNNSEAYLKILVELSECFNVSTDYLLGNTDDPTPPNKKSEWIPYEKISKSFYEGYDSLSEEGRKEIENYMNYLLQKEKSKENK